MEQLKYYLRHTNLKLEELCPLVGIGSITTLHRTFQKHFGRVQVLIEKLSMGYNVLCGSSVSGPF